VTEAPLPPVPGLADQAWLGTAVVALCSVCFGLVPFFARSLTEAGIAAPAIAFFRYLFPAVAFLPFLRLRGAEGRASLWGYVSGFCVGLGWLGYVLALDRMPVSTAGVLYMTYPMFTLVFAWAFFADRPAPRAMAGGVLILIAAVLASRPSTAGQPLTAVSILLGLAAPLSFGLAINVTANKLAILPPLSRVAVFALGSATGLVPLIATYPVAEVLPADGAQWALVVGLAVLTALLPQLLYTTFVPKIGGAKAAALGSIELPTMFAVGWLAFAEPLGPREAAAGALVLTAILMTPARRRPPASQPGTAA